jgi:hypothetical protein
VVVADPELVEGKATPIWLVVWNIIFFHSVGNFISSQLTKSIIFSEGLIKTTNQLDYGNQPG